MEGRKDGVRMGIAINTGNFTNDMISFVDKDDDFTLLVHLGYLGYNFEIKSVFIPNILLKK